jgi:sialate O-acetylesterase
MIKDWRQKWNINFPFYFVQLANYTAVLDEPAQAKWAELREAQLQTLHLENTGMAVTIDIGETNDIHPKNKQEVGRRLSLIARANAYKEKINFSGPVYDSFIFEGSSIRIKFKNTEDGLKSGGGLTLKGFTIAGLDHKFQWAEAKIDGNDVVVSCNKILNPIAVRYAWSSNPICNLCNGVDLPASPFRTDDWQGITFGKK